MLFLQVPTTEMQYFALSMLINLSIIYVFQLESEDNRKNFVNSARTLLRQYAFDGLDLAWEFPEIYAKKDRGTLGEYRCYELDSPEQDIDHQILTVTQLLKYICLHKILIYSDDSCSSHVQLYAGYHVCMCI
jgi:hypothetical protein